jgi:hypothetical protein
MVIAVERPVAAASAFEKVKVLGLSEMDLIQLESWY